MVRQAPLGHDRTATRDDAGDTVGGQRHVAQQHAGVDGEVVHALLGLLDQRVAEHLPGQVLGDAAGLVQRLVDRHRADGYRRVAQDPFAGFMDVLAGGQVHDGVGAPADRPHHLFHFLGQRRGHGGVAEVAVDLDAEIAPDRHRLQFGVVDVGGNDRAARGDLLAHEFRRHVFRTQRQAGAQRVAGMLAQQRLVLGLVVQRLQVQRLAQRHVFHFRRDDAAARIVHLRHVGTGLGAARIGQLGKAQVRGGGVVGAVAAVFRRQALEHFGIAALIDPLGAQRRQAGLQVDMHVRVAVRARGVVHRDRRIGHVALFRARGSLQDRAQRHADVRTAAGQVGLAGSGVGKLLVEVALERFEGCSGGSTGHGCRPLSLAGWTKPGAL
ncbi:hypothetical protein D9M72_210740 [compost metagenome]